jgi:1,2-diacylglycerol 3-beta-glucosyltransferase
LLHRTAPQARQGKGEALNAAIRHLTGTGMIGDRDTANVIIVVIDADGRLDTHAMVPAGQIRPGRVADRICRRTGQ